MDVARVVEVYAPNPDGSWEIGSGYRISERLVLTAAHVVTGLPQHPPESAVPDDPKATGVGQVRLGEPGVTAAAMVWRDEITDVALLRLADSAPPLPAGSPAPRWGRVEGSEPVAVDAVGFPWAQQRPDEVRDTEHLFGFLAPASHAKAGQLAITVLTSPPGERTGGSPWAGMSGAALFAGPFLVGVVVVDPVRFGTDRVVAAPMAPLLADLGLAGLLGPSAAVTPVEPRLRLAVTADTSVAIASPYRPATGRLGREPSRLLLPEYGVVPFLGRDTALENLQEWCLTGGGAALRLLLGAGGSGKTRLAAEACLHLAGNGWQAGLAQPDAPGGEPVLAFDRATLLVIDDADLNVALLAAMVQVLGYWPPDAPPVRLLLLARHTAGWWDTLNERTDHLAAELADPALTLRDGELGKSHRATHHAEAVAAFTRFLLTPQDQAPAAGLPRQDLSDAAFANPLLVHMHALLAATGAQVPTTESGVRERILGAVLDRERRRWADTFPAHVPTGGRRTHQHAVTVTTLLAPPTEQATTDLLTLVGDLSDAPTGARAAVTTWLHERYPGAEPPWVAPLRPDLLTEELLATCPDLTDLVLTGYQRVGNDGSARGAEVDQLLTEITRAASRDRVHGALDWLLAVRLPDLLNAAIANPTGRLPDLLTRALTTCPQPHLAAALARRLPEETTGLAALAATLTAQAVDHLRHLADDEPDTHTPALAGALNNLAIRLSNLGRREDALAAAREAVSTYRRLPPGRPGAANPNLAASLHNLSNRLGEIGRPEEALTPLKEAVTAYRELAADRPDAFNADLAMSLMDLSNWLADLGHRQEALTAAEEGVTKYRQLAADRPDAFNPDLAGALNNLSLRLAERGRPEDALTFIQEAVTAYRRQAAAHPDAFKPHLAMSLHNLSLRLADRGRPEDALVAAEEAVTIYRRLAGDRPDAFTPALATTLNNLSLLLAGRGRPEEALTFIEEAVTAYRWQAAAHPDAFTPGLAMSLTNLAILLVGQDRSDAALAPIEEAVRLYRPLAEAHPDAVALNLATSLQVFGSVLAKRGRDQDALAVDREATTLLRDVYAGHPDWYRDAFASALSNLAIQLRTLHLNDEAEEAEREASELDV